MSRTLLGVMIDELTIVRLICQNSGCGAVTEFQVRQLETREYFNCPFCQHKFMEPRTSHFANLANAIRELTYLKDKLGVEFIIPEKEPK